MDCVDIEGGSDGIPPRPEQAADLEQALNGAADRSALERLAGEIGPLQAALAQSGMDGIAQARTVTGLMDALTRRLIRLTERALPEPAPGPWAWLACGSQGRAEQTVHTDQDNALVYADGLPEGADDWYRALAERVTAGLAACGLPHCPGGVSPANKDWRRSVSGWQHALRSVIEAPERKAVMLATHYLDLRVVAGDRGLFEPIRDRAVAAAAANRRFVARLGDGAVRPRPPWHALGRIWTPCVGEHAGRVDVKQGAILPLVQLARVYAVRAGVTAYHTLDRLAQAAKGGALPEEDAEQLAAAYRAVIAIRARLHAEAIRAGRALHNQVPVADLTEAEYEALLTAFRAILRRQRALRQAVIREGL